MTWPTEQAREAVQHMSCVWIDCPGPHDPRHGPDGPRIARKKADRILAALAPHVAALVRAERAAALREAILADPGPLLDALPDDVLVEALVRRGVLAVEWGTGRPPEWAWEHIHDKEAGR